MAEIIPASGKGHKSGTRARRLSTKVDLTPMVDLGFLLITFFIFTTTASEAKVLKLNLPEDKSPVSTESSATKTMNLVLCADNKVLWYMGTSQTEATYTNFTDTGIREIVAAKKKQLLQKFKRADDLVVLIKPTSESSYQNLVNVLDEMTIGDVTRYILMEPDEGDRLMAIKR